MAWFLVLAWLLKGRVLQGLRFPASLASYHMDHGDSMSRKNVLRIDSSRMLIQYQHTKFRCVVSGNLMRLVDSPPMLIPDREQEQQGVWAGEYLKALEGGQRVACLTQVGADKTCPSRCVCVFYYRFEFDFQFHFSCYYSLFRF